MVAILPIALCLAGGCWNYRELNELALVAGVGVDYDERTNQVELTIQLIKPSKVRAPEGGGGAGGGGKESAVLVEQTRGRTVFDAVRNFVEQTNRKLFWAHTQVIVLGEGAARRGARSVLDFFLRDHEPRPGIWVLVARGKAAETMKTVPELESVPALEIGHLVEARAATSEASGVTLQEFASRLMSRTAAPVTGFLETRGEEGKEAVLTGTAVFKGDRLIGELDRKETRGLLWVLGEVKSGIIDVQKNEKEIVGLEIIKASGKVSPVLRGKRVRARVEIKAQTHLGDQLGSHDWSTPAGLEKLVRLQNEAIRREIRAAWSKARKLNADVFAFGEAVNRKYPRQWKKMEGKWESLFREVELEIRVSTSIHGTGLIMAPAAPQ
ncbi:MAG: Ger(x)C family spore germination protein [Bacteroidota bacterium]